MFFDKGNAKILVISAIVNHLYINDPKCSIVIFNLILRLTLSDF
jgi:hypothetical protein